MGSSDHHLARVVRGGWLALLTVVGLAAGGPATPTPAAAQAPGGQAVAERAAPVAAVVRVVSDSAGARLQVDGRDFLVRGINWDDFPVGTNYSYSLWTQRDDVVQRALDREMGLARAMGVNAIRVYAGIPPRWVRYIWERYGIYTILNHPLGRYGVTAGGVFQAQTDYSDPRVRAALTREVIALVDEFRGTPGLLMWLLGNENNYGLQWKSAATENLPVGEREAAKARWLYSLVGEVARAIKARDTAHPVALANGEVQYIDLIAREARGLDVFGTNMYRGRSFGDAFRVVREKLGLPILFTEFGADAYDARERREDQVAQARYLLAQWQEIYEQTRGQGGVGNAIGGLVFQWSDGWWKVGQDTRLDVHDTDAGWSNAAYADDYVAGANNMNEEWWGVMAKGPTDSRGQFELYPRAAYYALQQVFALDPYAPGTDRAAVRAHFAAIDPNASALAARTERPGLLGGGVVQLTTLRLDLATFSTGGSRLSTQPAAAASPTAQPAFRGFDRLESFYVGATARPSDALVATVVVNVLGNVPANPINEIFYENRGRPRSVLGTNGQPFAVDDDRVAIYRAGVSWDADAFRLDGFYRTGHFHWGYEGDFFGLYREANYGTAIDIYNGAAPIGVELTGKRSLTGLRAAFGPQLWWGANPSALALYRRRVGPLDLSAMYQEDITRLSANQTTSSFAIPLPATRRATLAAATTLGPFGVQAGGIWAGSTRVGQPFQIVEGGRVLQDRIRDGDAVGGKAKVTLSRGRYNWFAQGALMGLVADGGPQTVPTFTGWHLGDTGMSDQWNVMTGLTAQVGRLQIAPMALYQKPLVGPVPANAPAPARPRNVIDDPFVVRANREMAAGELLLTWDPTPATWMYQWDNDLREDAGFAANIAYVYRHMPTTMDAAIGFLPDGRTPFAFPGATPARDLWEVRGRVVTRAAERLRLIANLYGGTAEPTGDSPRLLKRVGGDLRVARGSLLAMGAARFNDWGPYDYHRDFNLTFPQQYVADVSAVFGAIPWLDAPSTRGGIRGTWRTLDRYSPRYCPTSATSANGVAVCDATAPGPRGREFEIRTYLTVAW